MRSAIACSFDQKRNSRNQITFTRAAAVPQKHCPEKNHTQSAKVCRARHLNCGANLETRQRRHAHMARAARLVNV